jgi:hypothetical protein
MPLESLVSDATISSITYELPIAILEASFTLICDVYSTGITYDNYQLKIVICLYYRPLDRQLTQFWNLLYSKAVLSLSY